MDVDKCAIRGCLLAPDGELCKWHESKCSKCERCLKWFTNATLMRHDGFCVRCFDKDLHERKIDQYNSRKPATEIAKRFAFYRHSNPVKKELREEYREERQKTVEDRSVVMLDDDEAELSL